MKGDKTMTKRQMIAELDNRLREYHYQYEIWQKGLNGNVKAEIAQIVAEYFKGKAAATEEAIKLIAGQK